MRSICWRGNLGRGKRPCHEGSGRIPPEFSRWKKKKQDGTCLQGDLGGQGICTIGLAADSYLTGKSNCVARWETVPVEGGFNGSRTASKYKLSEGMSLPGEEKMVPVTRGESIGVRSRHEKENATGGGEGGGIREEEILHGTGGNGNTNKNLPGRCYFTVKGVHTIYTNESGGYWDRQR